MGLLDWFKRRQRREDEAALEREEALAVETPEERAESSGDVEGMRADEGAARLAGEASVQDAERLGDDE